MSFDFDPNHDVECDVQPGGRGRGACDCRRSTCPKCGGHVRDATDGPYRSCSSCGHVTDSDPGYS